MAVQVIGAIRQPWQIEHEQLNQGLKEIDQMEQVYQHWRKNAKPGEQFSIPSYQTTIPSLDKQSMRFRQSWFALSLKRRMFEKSIRGY